jgi:arabinan endo-1,5-alpha-L-arabinosidase
VFRGPANGTLWLTYRSYFGFIRLVQLDPMDRQRLHPAQPPVNVAINSEASIMIFDTGSSARRDRHWQGRSFPRSP